MKHAVCRSVGLALLLSSGVMLGLGGETSAEAEFCKGQGCNDKNPTEYHCDRDAIVTTETTIDVTRPQDDWQPQQIIVQKLHSNACRADWARAYIPGETYLFIREREPVGGNRPIHGMIQARGAGYFWADSNMANSNAVNQACISLSTGVWFWYDRYCTAFN